MENTSSAKGWIASPNQWDARLYDRNHAYVWQYGADLIGLLAPQRGEQILDLGCGTGHLTAKIAEAGADVVGLDRDVAMIAQARAHYPRLPFIVADGTSFNFTASFDAVFSNAALHWIPAPARVVACVWRALKPGGRFVVEFGGQGNIRTVVAAVYRALDAASYPERRALNPWYFPSVGEYATLLEKQGFQVAYAALFDRPTALNGTDQGLVDWLEMFATRFFPGISVDERLALMQKIEADLRPTLYRDGHWVVDYRRLRVVAVKNKMEEIR